MAAKKKTNKKSNEVKCKMVPTKAGGKKVRRCFKGGKFVKAPKSMKK